MRLGVEVCAAAALWVVSEACLQQPSEEMQIHRRKVLWNAPGTLKHEGQGRTRRIKLDVAAGIALSASVAGRLPGGGHDGSCSAFRLLPLY